METWEKEERGKNPEVKKTINGASGEYAKLKIEEMCIWVVNVLLIRNNLIHILKTHPFTHSSYAVHFDFSVHNQSCLWTRLNCKFGTFLNDFKIGIPKDLT